MSHLNSPMAEHIIRPEPGVVPDEDELFYRLFDGEPDAVDGFVDLDSTRPGLGLTLNDEVLGSLRIDI
jgi:L-alanine-DL-glutamate epimerase-like enolase superfamily enzyme